MPSRFVLILFIFFFPASAVAATGAPPDHSAWAHLLDRWLVEGKKDGSANLFDYAGLKASPDDKAKLDAYIAALERIDPGDLSRPDAFAFWTNLYNALTVKVVVEHYPVASIRDIRISPGLFSIGPWGRKLVTVSGRELSLDDIEHGILRPEFADSRVHYAVNCASIGCPNLAARPFDGTQLDDMLDNAARAYVNSSRGARVENGRLIVSSIFKWYREDFGGSEEGIVAELRRFAAPDLAEKLGNISRVSAYDYDWSLNDASLRGESE